ncbi:hypothetical protein [Novipirellula caenicola]
MNATWLSVVALSAVACVADWTPLMADDGSLASDPYVVFVAQDEAYARCGPSDEFYRTDPLRYGQELEVYVETADGWLGVRPPDDSFCWVPADAVEVARDGDTAVVTEDRTVAWIGTHLGRARQFRWQVQLAVGEPVTIIGKGEREGADGPRLWYRIVPPSGEFRWVHQSQIAESAEQLVQAIRKQRNTDIEFLPGGSTTRRDSPSRDAVANSDTPPSHPHPIADEEDSFAGRGTLSSDSSSRRHSHAVPASLQNTPSVLLRDPDADSHAGNHHSSVSLSQVTDGNSPQLREAPRVGDAQSATEAIGSGVSEQWRSNPTDRTSGETAQNETVGEAMSKRGLLASVEFIGRPRLADIDAGIRQIGGGLLDRTSAGGDTASAGTPSTETNWVTGSTRGRTQSIQQVAGSQPLASATATTSPPVSPIPAAPAPATRYVSAAAIAAVETEVRTADIEKLSLIFSRLMAASASAAEMGPVAKAANQIATSAPDQATAERARSLSERIQKYQNVAQRRDGTAVIQASHTPSIPSMTVPASVASISPMQPRIPTQPQTAMPAPADVPLLQTPPGIAAADGEPENTDELTATGFLVQVYSARKDSPPFAITDSTGRTLAYATPSPGLNLRMHLNSEVRIHGTRSYLQGLNTPHIRVARAVRTAEY